MMGAKTGSPAEIGVFALLAALADPDGIAKRLAALKAATEDANAGQVKMQESVQAAAAVGAKAAEAHSKAHQAIEQAAERMQIVQAAQQAVTDAELALEARLALVVAREDVSRDTDSAQEARDAALVARENEVRVREERVTALQTDYENRIKRLQAAAAGA